MQNIHSLLVLGPDRHPFLSPSLSTYRVKVPKSTNGRESCVELVHAIVLGLPRVHPNTTKQIVAYFYPLCAPVKAVDDKVNFSPAGIGFRRRGAPSVGMEPKSRGCHTMCLEVLQGS